MPARVLIVGQSARPAADLEAERASLEQEVDLSLYPVIGAGLVWRF